MTATEQTIMRLSEYVKRNPQQRHVHSTGEKLAVALVLNRPAWLKDYGYTMLGAVDRLGDEWTRAAINVQKAMGC